MIDTKIYHNSQDSYTIFTVRKAYDTDDDCIFQWNQNEEKQMVEVSFKKKYII